jgi:2-oxo-4-hydroxy-4-carboxy--5-ureidoimidazoline (OHCU) decarboxylase
VRDLPRKLSAEELAELFEGRTALVQRLSELEDPLGQAGDVIRVLTENEKIEALNAHPAIGAGRTSAASAREQGSDDDPEVLEQLAQLNRAYEVRFGFRFVVFVDRRQRREIIPILRERLDRTREEELDTGVRELVAIARDRWQRA